MDGDAIPWRTLPGTHPTKGAYFTRGTSRDRFAKYSEEGAVYQDNMQRLLRKFETAKSLVPAPVVKPAKEKTRYGVIYFGSTSAGDERSDGGAGSRGHPSGHDAAARLSLLRRGDAISSTPMTRSSWSSRTATPRCASLLVNECGIDPARFISILQL